MSVTLKGILLSSAVSVTAGNTSVSIARYGDPQTGSKSVAIEVTNGTGVAPLGVFFKAVVSGFDLSGEDAEHSYDYIWDLGATSAALYPLSDRNTSVWSAGTNAAYLPRVSQTYTDTGAQTAQVWVSDGVDIVTATVTIAPDSPDSVFAGTRTIYVDGSGTFGVRHTGTPAGATYVATTDQAYTAFTDAPDNSFVRILFRAGQTHDPMPDQFTDVKHVSVGRYGAGARPVLDCGAGHGLRPTEHVLSFRCQGLNFLGGWNAATETGIRRDGIAGNVHAPVVIHDCEFDGLSASIQLNAGIHDTGWYAQISNCRITNWQNYGILFPKPLLFGLVGCSIRQNPDARGGGRGKDVVSNHHGPVRTSAPNVLGWTSVRLNDLFSCSSWTTASGKPSHQPTFRWNSAGVKDATAFFERNIHEGGRQVMSFDPGSAGGTGHRNNLIFQMSMLIATANSADSMMNLQLLGITVRNNIFYHPDVMAEDGGILSSPITLATSFVDADHEFGRCDIHNNTYIDQRSTLHATNPNNGQEINRRIIKQAEGSRPPNAREENNLRYFPNRTPPDVSQGPLDQSLPFAPLYKGRKWIDEPGLDTSFASPADTIIAAHPQVGVTGMSGLTALRDLSGTLWTGGPDTRAPGALHTRS